jgi:hypothetical protein
VWPLAVALMALGGCDEPASVATAPPARFDFKMIDTGSIDVAAHEGSAPLAGVLAQVRAAGATPGTAGSVLWTGATGVDGHAHGTIRTERLGGGSLEVTLNKSGYVGPWTDANARASFGAFAPSAQVITSVTGLRSLDLSFERTP